MSHRISEQLRQLALECTRLSKDCPDIKVSRDLEGIGTRLAEKAKEIDQLFNSSDPA